MSGIMIDERLKVLEKIKVSLPSEDKLSVTFHQIGMMYQGKEELDRALGCFEKAKAKEERRQDEGGLSITLHQIGRVYQQKGDLDKAFLYYQEALEKLKKTDNISHLLTDYNNIITVLLEAKRFVEAERYIIDALSIEKQVLYDLSPEIVIPRTLITLRYAMMIRDRARDKTTLEMLLSSPDFRRLSRYLEEDSGI